jgi:hypothetical protein
LATKTLKIEISVVTPVAMTFIITMLFKLDFVGNNKNFLSSRLKLIQMGRSAYVPFVLSFAMYVGFITLKIVVGKTIKFT